MSMRGEQNSRKNDDCYFYYYSTCLKGDNCLFRHEKNALGCEVVCQYWKEGKCLNEQCNFRHMELKKNRKAIPCYWESQPGGCRKPHCPFRHAVQKDKPPDKAKEGEAVASSNIVLPNSAVPVMNVAGSASSRSSNSTEVGPIVPSGQTVPLRSDLNYANPSVDRVVVKFEEESDNESVPSLSLTPQKRVSSPKSTCTLWPDTMKVKTLEEIRLERVQKQSAAFYGMDDCFGEDRTSQRRVKLLSQSDDLGGRLQMLGSRCSRKRVYEDYRVLTLEEIRKNRRQRIESSLAASDDYYDDVSEDESGSANKKIKRSLSVTKCLPDSTSETEQKEHDDFLIHDQVIKLHTDDKMSDNKDHDIDTPDKNDDELMWQAIDDIRKIEEKCKDSKLDNTRPIKLRRFTCKRAIVDNDSDKNVTVRRAKLKRVKLTTDNNDLLVSDNNVKDSNNLHGVPVKTNTNNDYTNLNIEDLSFLSSSSVHEDLQSEDILRDIDDMLNG